MKSFKFFSTALFVLFTSSIFNAASGAELYVMFKPNIVKTEAAVFAKGQVTTDFIQSKSVTTILNKYGCSSINATVPKEWADTISYAEDGSLIKTLDLSRIYKMVFPETKENLNSLINELENDPDVAFVDKPFNIVLHAVPDDPSFGLLWGLSQSNDCDIDATEAWDVFKGSSSIIIGIMDTGVKLDHEDLYGKASGEEPTGSTSSDGHGTHVAGTAAAIANNGKGVTGVDWNARIYSKNVLSLGDDPTKMYLCLKSAVDNGCHVLNNSWGDGGDGTFNRSAIRSAFAYMYKMNRVAVTSMGNNNTSTPQSPAAFGQGIIAVGATDKYDARASYSSYGSHIDVVAPGGETYNDNRAIYSSSFVSTTSYEYKAGTSMAAPHVSGLASLLKGYNPNLSNDDIEQIIRISADNVPNMGGADWDQYYGHGRINARKALDLVGGPNYCINRWSATGATTYQKSSMGSYSFYTVPGLAEGPYLAYRYEIRKTVTFPVAFSSVPTVWGRGVGSNGYNADFANYALPFTEVVPGTVTKTGCVLRTYIYEVYNYVPQRVGWFPYENPASAVFQYTVLAPYTAPASAKISGWYEPYTATKAPIQPAGYINLSWSCVSGTLPIKYTVQVKEPYTTGTWTNVISNTTITSCRLQHEPYTGGSGYRVIVNDGKTTLTSNAVVIYPPNPGDPIVSYSTTAEATAHSNGKKLVIDNSGKLHVVFTSNDTVYHTTSVDDGETWSTQSAVGQGKNPAIEMTSSYKPTICWSKGNELYNSQHSADVWGAPQLIYTGPAGSEVSYLAYVLDRNTNNSYLGWVDEGDAGSSVLISPYTPGGSGQLAPSPIDQGGADAFKSPSLALDRTGKLKITWSRDGKVYYYDQAGQLELGENGIHPIVETYGDRTSVVWQEEIAPGIYQIVKRNKGPLGWNEKQVISYPDEKNADFPVVAANGQYVYSKNTTGKDYDIVWHGEYDNGWTQYERNISYASGGLSKYPSACVRQLWPKSKLYILWTEDLPDAKAIIQKPVKIYAQSIEPVPYYYADLGTEEAAVYTTQKAGTLTYGQTPDLTVDYHPNQLKYSFSGLDPSRTYMLKAVYYHESYDRIQQKMKIDGQQFDVANLKPEEKVEFKRWLMPKLYSDGQIDITIDKQKGEYAVCAILSIEEYEKDCDNAKDGGAQAALSETKPVPYHYELMPNSPNPARGQTTFRYQLAQSGKTTFKVYNTLGQAVKTIVDAYQQPGVYSVNWDGKDTQGKKVSNGVYFYRINSGEFDATKKMVILK